LLLEKLKVFVIKEVEGFCFFFWMLKVFVVSFEYLRFLLLLFDVEGYCFYFWMFKVFTFGFRCWKFLFLLLNIEGSYFCFWMLNVLALIFKCWRFLLLDVHQNYVYKVRFFQKYLKFYFNLPHCKHNILLYLQVYKL